MASRIMARKVVQKVYIDECKNLKYCSEYIIKLTKNKVLILKNYKKE